MVTVLRVVDDAMRRKQLALIIVCVLTAWQLLL